MAETTGATALREGTLLKDSNGRLLRLAEPFNDGAWGCDIVLSAHSLVGMGWVEMSPAELETCEPVH